MKKQLALLYGRIFLITCAVLLFFGIFDQENPYPYQGEHKALYTTAIYSIPDAQGYMHHGEGTYDSDIYIWEQDNYGRTLFSYCEDYGNQIFGLVIAQACDETNVYFYPDRNYVLTLIDSEYVYEGVEDDHLKNKTEAFYLENREKLKAENDWNQPIDETKCVCYPITDHKVLDKNTYSLPEERCDAILNEYAEKLNLSNPDKTPHRYNRILQVDTEGKILHEIYGICKTYNNLVDKYISYQIVLWVITDQDGNYDKEIGVMVMDFSVWGRESSYTYNAEDVLEFKQRNNWTYLYCGE